MNRLRRAHAPVFLLVAGLFAACGGGSSSNAVPTQTGQACQLTSDCYPGIDAGSLRGAPACLTQVQNGYCTHSCSTDNDCCAVAGECPAGLPEVCSPFESTSAMDCFLSCEADQVMHAGFTDDTAYCQKYASAAFTCRSTGGGSNNRKVCLPN